MRFTFEFFGEKQFDREFNRVTETLDDLTPVWKEVQTEFFDIEGEQFDSEGAKGKSGRWKELSANYKEVKSRLWGGDILHASGRLENSLTKHTTDTIEDFGKQEATYGTSVPYAEYHQKGAGRVPVRKVIDLSDSQKTQLTKVIQKSLLKLIKQKTTL
jgi:phage gpG-like protein